MKDDEFMRKHIDALNKLDKEFEKLNKNIDEMNVYLSQIAKYCVNKYNEEHWEPNQIHTNPEDSIRTEENNDKVAWIKTKFSDPTLFCSVCGAEVGLKGFTAPAKCHKCGRTFIGVDNVL